MINNIFLRIKHQTPATLLHRGSEQSQFTDDDVLIHLLGLQYNNVNSTIPRCRAFFQDEAVTEEILPGTFQPADGNSCLQRGLHRPNFKLFDSGITNFGFAEVLFNINIDFQITDVNLTKKVGLCLQINLLLLPLREFTHIHIKDFPSMPVKIF